MKNTEFKAKQFKDATVYTLESASSGGTSAGSVASVSSPMGGVRKRGDNLIAQEANTDKIDASKPRNFVAKNAKTGGAGAHKDKKKAAKQGDVKHKNKQADMAEGSTEKPDVNKKEKKMVPAEPWWTDDKGGKNLNRKPAPKNTTAEGEYNPDTFVGKKGTYKGYGITQDGPHQWGISSSARKFSTLAAAKRHIDKVLVVSEQGVAEGFSDVVKGIKRKVAGKDNPKEVEHTYGRIARSAIKHKTPDQAEKDIKRWEKVNKVVNKEGVAEGSEQVYKVIAVDKSNYLGGKEEMTVKADSIEDLFSRLSANDWYPLEINGVEVIAGKRLKQGVAEGFGDDYRALSNKVDQYLIKAYQKFSRRDQIIDAAKAASQKAAEQMGIDPNGEHFKEIWMNALAGHDVDTDFGDNDSDFDYTDYSMRKGEKGVAEADINRRGILKGIKAAALSIAEDHEIQMASSELEGIAKNAVHLLDLVRKYSEQEGLEAWQQSKITKAADYLNAVLQAVSGEQNDLNEGMSDYVGDAIEGLRSSKPGLSQEDFLDELYMYIENQYGSRAAEMAFNHEDYAVFDEWYDSYTDMAEDHSSMGQGYGINGYHTAQAQPIQPGAGHNMPVSEDEYMAELFNQLSEKIPANAPVDVWIKDFEKSNAPQFRGKNKEKRRQMAIAASYGAKNPSKKKKK